MSKYHVEASEVIDAAPKEIYAVLADYRVGHMAIVPKQYFTAITIEKGGQGAGTELRSTLKVWGREFHYHQIVTEPDPGRVLMETDLDTGQYTTFTVEPLDGGKQSRLTIHSEFPVNPGLMGQIEKFMAPLITGRIYKEELQLISNYMRSKSQPVTASS